jgi:hypothetical protein
MSRIERKHERISGPITEQYLQENEDAGWRLVAVTWERQVRNGAALPHLDASIPFGLRVSEDCGGLIEDEAELNTLLAMIELIVQDRPLSEIAGELNRRGARTRNGTPWNPGTVFDLLPRMIEVGSQVFGSDQWANRRRHFLNIG